MIRLPQHISMEMARWRMGLAPFPASFNEFHRQKAEADMARQGFDVLRHEGQVRDGFGDGARFVQIVVEDKGRLRRLRWHESGAWFEQSPESGAWLRYAEMKPETMGEFA